MRDLAPPSPVFDLIERLKDQSPQEACAAVPEPLYTDACSDFLYAQAFLLHYTGSSATLNAYRRELEHLLAFCWHVEKCSVLKLQRHQFETYLSFRKDPPLSWIARKKFPRFIEDPSTGKRIPNPLWRPFVSEKPEAYQRTGAKAFHEVFAIASSFYQFLIQEGHIEHNPVAQIRQKSKFIRKQQSIQPVRRLSERQWHYVIQEASLMANEHPEHERTLFVLSILYSLYLRISELCASARWVPQMNHFYRDREGLWWFVTVGKGNKERHIAVSASLLESLKRYRKSLGLSPLPQPSDLSPLIPRLRGHGPITHTTHIRRIVQACFDRSIQSLFRDGHEEDAELLRHATVHWLRHTGISDDVKHRPREHVRDDAGHGSGAITDRYIDVELRKRHESAQDKVIIPEKTNP